MKLLFQKIRYQNLLSTGNVFTEIDLNQSHMSIICGKNGEGKSTILDALCFGLFNKPFRKIKLGQLINSSTGKKLLVEIEFQGNGHSYMVRRGQKPALFEVYMNGELINQDAATKDYQTYLEKNILRTNFKTFTQTAILGSASYVPFMQLPAASRREVIEDLYDLRVFSGMNLLLKKRAEQLDDKISEKETVRRLLTQRLELSRNQQEVLAEEKQKQIEEKRKEAAGIVKELGGEAAEQTILEHQIEVALGEMLDISALRKAERSFGEICNTYKAERVVLNKEINFLENNDGCPTCKQVIDEKFKTTSVTEKKLAVDVLNVQLDNLMLEVGETAKKIVEAEEIENKISNLRSRLYTVTSMIKTLMFNHQALEKGILRLTSEKEVVADPTVLTKIEDELLVLSEEKIELLKDADVMQYASVLLKDSGIKSRIIKKYTPVLNQIINSYLAKLDFFVDFQLDENFEETIKSRGRDTFSYASFSEGEKLRIDLAILFAWRNIARMRASLDVNICFLDEILDSSLDQEGMEELLKIMKQNIDGNLFVISHRTDQISDHFDHTLRFEKVKGFSRITSP